jgi:hypothetical protein
MHVGLNLEARFSQAATAADMHDREVSGTPGYSRCRLCVQGTDLQTAGR